METPPLPLPTAPKRRGKLFQPGNQAAKGRRNPGEKLREMVRKATKQSDVKAVYAMMAEKARAGDPYMTKLYMSYAVGEPQQVVQVTHKDDKVDIPAAIQALLASGASLAAELELDVQFLQPAQGDGE